MEPNSRGTLDSNGVPIHYEVYRRGEPIVLVHGFASSIDGNWASTGWIDTLTPIRQVIALDCRGHGLSGKPREAQAYSGNEMVNDVIRLMDHLKIGKADLFGYSMGSAISLRALVLHPDRFRSVVLGGIGDMLAHSEGGRSNVVKALLADDPATISDPLAKGFRVFAEANKNDLKALAAYQQASREPLKRHQLAGVSLPVLVVNGERDDLVGSPDKLVSAISGAQLTRIPDRDHLTVVPDQRFKEAVVRFLTGDGRGQA
jgi:pimeloyl-ACP methyl ester carboxylesterase